jgi:hypothetical protein
MTNCARFLAAKSSSGKTLRPVARLRCIAPPIARQKTQKLIRRKPARRAAPPVPSQTGCRRPRHRGRARWRIRRAEFCGRPAMSGLRSWLKQASFRAFQRERQVEMLSSGALSCHPAGARVSLCRRHAPGARDADQLFYLMSRFGPRTIEHPVASCAVGTGLVQKPVMIPVALAGYRGQTRMIEDADDASGVAGQP